VIENIGGAGGTIGSARVATAKSDGYTLLAGSMGSHVAAPVLTPEVKYDSERDFEPIGFTAQAPAVVVARKDFPAKDLKEFIAYVRKNGDSVKQAHGGIGSSSHMACLMFNSELGLNPRLIAYRGTGPALNDLLGGHVDFFCEQVVSVAAAVQSGTIKAYGVSSDKPVPSLPGVPAAKDAGAPSYQMSIWSAVFAPKGTPAPVVAKLNEALNEALDDPTVRDRLVELGGRVPAKEERGPANLAKLLKSEIARWAPILKSAAALTN
jgi:tripartite-type tricarboxylate transporter receptor subunit TctC